MRPLSYLSFFLIAISPLFSYEVSFQGVDENARTLGFKAQSLCYSQKDKPLTSISALKRRAQKDQEKFVELAHYHGYYAAKVFYTIQYGEPPKVTFHVTLGKKFVLQSVELVASDNPDALAGITPKDLKLELDKPINSQAILDAQKELIWLLKKRGYAACKVVTNECVANVTDESLSVKMHVSVGPLVRFGRTRILGNSSVVSRAIVKSIAWNEGEVYDPHAIEKTQNKLEKTALFTSVIIAEEEPNLEDGWMPMTLQVQESKHHSIAAGVAYATSFGPGVKGEWENRNLRGLGEKLTFRTEWWQRYQTALLSWTKPHFRKADQDFISVIEYDKLHTRAFDSRAYNISALLQSRESAKSEFLRGLRAEWLHAHNFEGTHFYHLLKVPLQYKWSNANNLLDPVNGQTINVKLTPTSNFLSPSFFYVIHTTSLAGYHSFFSNHLTLAAKVTFGNIMGAARHTIPPPDRFYGGSENVLRGYRAFTVSPLHHKRTPIGGRSLVAGTIEARMRTTGNFGWALFYDVGNVYSTNIPELTIHQYNSVGTGIRYATPIGPLRLDLAVPLNRRHKIDPSFQIYFSIGQAF